MGASLKKDGDELVVKLGGYDDKDDFMEALERAKNITPRRYDPETKAWRYPYDINVAMRIVHALEPDMSAEVLAWVRDAGTRVAEELQSRLPDDAALALPSATEWFPFQRAAWTSWPSTRTPSSPTRWAWARPSSPSARCWSAACARTRMDALDDRTGSAPSAW